MIKVLPVIHHISDDLAYEQALLAKSLKADGIFLISHCGTNDFLPALGAKIKNDLTLSVGINLLGEDILTTAQIAHNHNLDMIWGDNCGVTSLGLDTQGEALSLWAKENPQIQVFASVAFKYQKKEMNPPLAAKEAQNAGFIATTSGSGTGYAPSLEKIVSMANVVDNQLAVASGMDCENVHHFKPYLSHILVATGVSLDENHFDIDKLAKFIEIVKK